MKFISSAMFTTFISLLAHTSAQAEMEVMFENTLVVTAKTPAGDTMQSLYFEPDGSISTDSDILGAWNIDAGDVCITLTGYATEPLERTVCTDLESMESAQIGDKMAFETESGPELMGEIVAGR